MSSTECGAALHGLRKIEIETLVQIAAATLLVKRKNFFVRPAEFWRHPGGFTVDERTVFGLEAQDLVKVKWCYNYRALSIPPHRLCATLTKTGRWTAARALAREADLEKAKAYLTEDAIGGGAVPVAGRERQFVDPLRAREVHDGGSSSELVPARSLSGAEN